MLSLARNGFTAEQVDAALHAPSRRIKFRYDLLDMNNNFKQTLTTVMSDQCSVTMDTTQQIARTAQFMLQDDGSINYLTDRIQPWVLVWVPPNGWAEFPLGVFILSTPPRQTDAAQVITRQINGYDLTQILVDEKVQDRYTVAAGTNYISAVASLLSTAGITQTNLTATSLTLPTAKDYEIGTAFIDIINDLLSAINYRPLWFDANGVAQAMPYMSPSVLPPAYTYQDDSQSVMTPEVNDNLDLFDVPNVWVCTVDETDTTTLVSRYVNDNPNSPTSTVNRGRQIVKYVSGLTAPNQATLDAYAQQQAEQDSQIYNTVVFETAIMPFHEAYDAIQLNYSVMGISDKFFEIGWSLNLAPGATMNHTIQKVVYV